MTLQYTRGFEVERRCLGNNVPHILRAAHTYLHSVRAQQIFVSDVRLSPATLPTGANYRWPVNNRHE